MQEEREIAEFNESMLQIQRLHTHWVELASYRENGDIGKALAKLQSIELELSYDANKLNYANKIVEVNKKISIGLKKARDLVKAKGLTDDDERANAFNLFLINEVMLKEKLLREIQNESGKGSRYKSTTEDDIE